MNTKRLLSTVVMLLIIGSLLLAACAPAAPAKDMSDPVTIVQTFYEAFNEKDLNKAMNLIAEDYVMNDPSGTYDRAAAMIQWQGVIDAGISFNPTNFVHTGNGRVTSCYEVFENGNMIDKGCGAVTRVRDGKIVFDGLLPAEQIWIAQSFYQAYNAGDLEALMALIDEDVQCRGGCYLTGKDRFQLYIQTDLEKGFQAEISDLKVEEDKVTYRVDVYSSAGFLQISGVETLHIKDGLIYLID